MGHRNHRRMARQAAPFSPKFVSLGPNVGSWWWPWGVVVSPVPPCCPHLEAPKEPSALWGQHQTCPINQEGSQASGAPWGRHGERFVAGATCSPAGRSCAMGGPMESQHQGPHQDLLHGVGVRAAPPSPSCLLTCGGKT